MFNFTIYILKPDCNVSAGDISFDVRLILKPTVYPVGRHLEVFSLSLTFQKRESSPRFSHRLYNSPLPLLIRIPCFSRFDLFPFISLSSFSPLPDSGGVELIKIRPKSKSRLLPNPYDDPEGEAQIIRNVSAEERADPLNLDEKKGYVKECVEDEGLAIIFSEENGLVIFHQEHCFHNCSRVDYSTFR